MSSALVPAPSSLDGPGQSSSTQSCPILQLPLELLLRILNFAALQLLREGQRSLRIFLEGPLSKPPSSFLRDASLVCKTFAVPAQLLMWETLFLVGNERARQFVASPAVDRYAVRRVQMQGLRGDVVGQVLGSIRLANQYEIDFRFMEVNDWLTGTGLSIQSSLRSKSGGLRNLILTDVSLSASQITTPPIPPFVIKSLHLDETVIHSITAAAPLFGPLLRELSLRYASADRSATHSHINELVLPLASQITSLTIKGVYYTSIDPAISRLTNLQFLKLDGPGSSVLLHLSALLPSPLTTLDFAASIKERILVVLDALNAVLQTPCGSQLHDLILPGYSRDLLSRVKGRQGTVAEWEKMGINVKFE